MRPLHINAETADFEGNDGRGRFLLLPGSASRARSIAERFTNRRVREHHRGHDLHLGTLERAGQTLDVGVISSGMGCPSVDLIATELIGLGAKVLLRVGTSGALQHHVHTGDVVVATAAVRDQGTSDHYLPREFPAVASFSLVNACYQASQTAPLRGSAHFGVVHTKDSLYAREMLFGPKAAENEAYTRLLEKGGILASEMECAHLFVLGQLGPIAKGECPVVTGAILAVIGEHDEPFVDSPRAGEAIEDAIELAFDSFAQLAQGR